MQVFILGPTGDIGEATTKELLRAGHSVTGLCRSDAAADRLGSWGGRPVRGDIRAPEEWIAEIAGHEGIINLADTFDADMPMIDRALMTALEAASIGRPRLLYTGGCWLYGDTGDCVAVETDPMGAIPAYQWAAQQAERVLASAAFNAAVVHPGMVYHEGGGVFSGFLEARRKGEPPIVTGGQEVRWPLIHRGDVAVAYRMLLERRGLNGHYNAVAEEGVPVGQIAAHVGGAEPVTRSAREAMVEFGDWAEGLALDQRISAAKLLSETGWRPKFTDYRDVF